MSDAAEIMEKRQKERQEALEKVKEKASLTWEEMEEKAKEFPEHLALCFGKHQLEREDVIKHVKKRDEIGRKLKEINEQAEITMIQLECDHEFKTMGIGYNPPLLFCTKCGYKD